jgi:hypothetical protein
LLFGNRTWVTNTCHWTFQTTSVNFTSSRPISIRFVWIQHLCCLLNWWFIMVCSPDCVCISGDWQTESSSKPQTGACILHILWDVLSLV